MGLTKQYLRFESAGIFGVVAAKTCNTAYLKPQSRFVATGGVNVVLVWDTRLQRKVATLNCDSPAVVIEPNIDSTLLAVGHVSGSVSVYDITDKSGESVIEPRITFDGHKSSVTSLAWDDSGTLLASGSKDTRIVIWDCVGEVGVVKYTAHKGSVTHLQFWKDSAYLISSSTDATIRLWDMTVKDAVHTIPFDIAVKGFAVWDDVIIAAESQLRLMRINQDPSNPLQWTTEEFGTLLRTAHDRVSLVKIVGNILVTTGTKSQLVETFYINNAEDAHKKRKKRLKKNPDGSSSIILRDLIRRGPTTKASEEKVKSVDGIVEKNTVKILCTLPSNQLEVFSFPFDDRTVDENKDRKPELLGFDGHRKIVRGICFSSDKTAILTASGDCFRVWNRTNMGCILSILHEYPVLCVKFCPGDRHFVAGTSCGKLLVGDIPLGKITHVEPCGNDSVWDIDILPSNTGFVSCCGSFLQFYEFLIIDGGLKFEMKRQLNVQETAISVKVSPDMKFVAAGLMDHTIKMFYLDTLKFHLSMYGHSLPPVSIDISSDSTLLVSCSADKTVKVWGMDFGDCHCSMSHSDGLNSCRFLERTHQVVSVAKETLNIYDADIHQRIQTLKAHVEGGATCLATQGKFIVSAGKDQTIRLFNRTQEVLVLSDEREQEREEELDKEATEEVPGVASLKTSESEKSADKLIEALDIYKDRPDSHRLMDAYGAKTHEEFILKTINMIKASELEQSIMLLPIEYVKTMTVAITSIFENYPLATEGAFRCLNALMKFHRVTLAGYSDKDTFKTVAELAAKRCKELQDVVGFNLAALSMLQNKKQEKEKVQTFKEMVGDRKRKRKNKEKALKRALLMV
ncbi:unnamed protein product [Orchesella dallaii]|uniref:Small-subunit processome Utp12 domain-containing protein n=1 Tax=Orchesella dallaii TaxID=48710 RepID=A0ABP1PZ26_9HEXA